ncbi:hypothetical protein [Bacillus subtilis]|uniref:hypothetical protein n=1 Tax=Bacillus subtilis TaxID=1423 RepID=UPI001F168272|nr:hypothetical protein [Bacillus subtilis]
MIKFSGKSVGFGSEDNLGIMGDCKKDSITISHETDGVGGLTTIYVNSNYICVDTNTLKCEVVSK